MFGVGHPRRNPDYMDNLAFVKGNCDFRIKFPENAYLSYILRIQPRTVNYIYSFHIVKGIFMVFKEIL
jgi:hypothetical protein